MTSSQDCTTETNRCGAILRKLRPVSNKTEPFCPNSLFLSKDKPCIIGRVLAGEVNVRILWKKNPHMISRKHATVAFIDGNWQITNHSTNGVFVNGLKLSRDVAYQLTSEDRVIMGCGVDGKPPEFEYIFKEVKRETNEGLKRPRGEGFEKENDSGGKKRCLVTVGAGSSDLTTSKTQQEITKEFDNQIKEKETKIESLINQLNQKEKEHEQLNKTLQKSEQNLIDELKKQKEQIEKEKAKEEKKLESLLEQQLLEKEKHLKSHYEKQIKLLEEEKDDVELNLQLELDNKLTEKDMKHKNELEMQKQKLNQILIDMENEKKSREAERVKNQELLNNLKNAEKNEKKLGSCLEELKRQINAKDEDLKKQQDKAKQAEAIGKSVFIQQMEDEFTCMICQELFIKTVTLQCAHSFCEWCLNTWMKRKRECPVCRKAINKKNKLVKSFVMDNAISKMIENADDETKQHRQEIINTRMQAERAEQSNQNNNQRARQQFWQHNHHHHPAANANRPPYLNQEHQRFRLHGGHHNRYCHRCGSDGHYASQCNAF